MKYKIPFIKPHFPAAKEVTQDFEAICYNNWFTNFGPFENKFRDAIAGTFRDEAHITTIANATLGLQAAIDVLMIGDKTKTEVVVPSFTFAAGPEVLIHSGLTPVFIDIEPESWQPSLDQASKYISENHKNIAGILLCNIFGVGNRAIEEWEELANKYSLPLVIDSAAGFGSLYFEGEPVGLRGDCEVFSLHATKPFSVGEGGLVISKNIKLINDLRSYQNFGFDKQKNINLIGTNAKLQELNCAIGIRQLTNFQLRLGSRRASLAYYKESLQKLGYKFMDNDNLSTVCFVSVLTPDSQHAQILLRYLTDKGVEVRQYYTPLHTQPVLASHCKAAGDLTATEDIAERIISLPLHDDMNHADIDYIIDTIKAAP